MLLQAEYIEQALSKNLPGAIAHLKMLPPGRVLTPKPEDKSRLKQSSVLLLLFKEQDKLIACLIKRPTHMKHHAGQIALPGGRLEKGESAIDAALRETEEEIGIPGTKIQILGQLTKFYVEVSQFEIQPFVGWLNKQPEVNLNSDEVEKIIFFPMQKFKPPHQQIELSTITGKLQVPCIQFNNETIWGATAMILSEFYDSIK